ncbi:MAG: hypothetical protein DMG57_22360 [Acidobacteria bacterium]|nr:MAG: hypothetical protein DMG57_22360 [Acidobacteriota bacterium]
MSGGERSMNRKINFTLALATGLLGGVLSRYLIPTPVFAQAQAPAPREIRAQSFVLVNKQGAPLGLMGFDSDGVPVITLLDENRRTIWSSKATLLLQSSK